MSLQSIFGGGDASAATPPSPLSTTPAPTPPPAAPAPAQVPVGGSGGGGFFSSVGNTLWDLLATTHTGQAIRALHEQRMQDDILRANAAQDPAMQAYFFQNPDAAERFHVETAPVPAGYDWRQDPDTAARMAANRVPPATDAAGNTIYDPSAATFHPAVRMLNAPALVDTKERAGIRLVGAQTEEAQRKAQYETAAARLIGGGGAGGLGGGGVYGTPEIDIAPGGPTVKYKPRTITEGPPIPPGVDVGQQPPPGPPLAGPSRVPPTAGTPPAAVPPRPAVSAGPPAPGAPAGVPAGVPAQPPPGTPHPAYPPGIAADPARLDLARTRTGGGGAGGGAPPPAPSAASSPAAAGGVGGGGGGAEPVAPAGGGGGAYPTFPKGPESYRDPAGNLRIVKQPPVSEEGKALIDLAGDDKAPNHKDAAAMIEQAGGDADEAVRSIKGALTLARDRLQERKVGEATTTETAKTMSERLTAIQKIKGELLSPTFDQAVRSMLPDIQPGAAAPRAEAEMNRLKWWWSGELTDKTGNIAFLKRMGTNIIPDIRQNAVGSKGNRITLPEIDLLGDGWKKLASGEMSQTEAFQFRKQVLAGIDRAEKEMAGNVSGPRTIGRE